MLKNIYLRTWINVKSKRQQFSGVLLQYRTKSTKEISNNNSNKNKVIKPRFRPGDWVCPYCQFHNHSFRNTCGECTKPIQVNQVRLGEWICPSCHYYNYTHVLSCKNCTELKPSPSIQRKQNQIK
ncbi:unnamed protein product [Cunninghamella blakesleeana]